MEFKKLDELGISPAPWKSREGGCCVDDANGEEVASTATYKISFGTCKANANIIAAAPELYETLRHLLETLDRYGFKTWRDNDPLAVAARRCTVALVKAGGEVAE